MEGRKVLSTPVMVRNGASVSVDYLEHLEFYDAPFYDVFFEIILYISNIQKCFLSGDFLRHNQAKTSKEDSQFLKLSQNSWLPVDIYTQKICYCDFQENMEMSFANLLIDFYISKTDFLKPDPCSVSNFTGAT